MQVEYWWRNTIRNPWGFPLPCQNQASWLCLNWPAERTQEEDCTNSFFPLLLESPITSPPHSPPPSSSPHNNSTHPNLPWTHKRVRWRGTKESVQEWQSQDKYRDKYWDTWRIANLTSSLQMLQSTKGSNSFLGELRRLKGSFKKELLTMKRSRCAMV